ncbi:hypothetical protein K1719_037153 [Acacia pycnantha]|nr:hypothetical protein K1719_037153 [Acacia pycnantha]
MTSLIIVNIWEAFLRDKILMEWPLKQWSGVGKCSMHMRSTAVSEGKCSIFSRAARTFRGYPSLHSQWKIRWGSLWSLLRI